MSRILIIEDEVAIADLEKDYLELNDFEVKIENNGAVGLRTALEEDFDLIILDLMLPDMDGFEICKKVREQKNVPILMVSAKKDDIDKIRGLGLGADDYLTKPFSPSELVARVKAHMARYNRLVGTHTKENDTVEVRGIRIDKTARRVFIDGAEKTFTTKNKNNGRQSSRSSCSLCIHGSCPHLSYHPFFYHGRIHGRMGFIRSRKYSGGSGYHYSDAIRSGCRRYTAWFPDRRGFINHLYSISRITLNASEYLSDCR